MPGTAFRLPDFGERDAGEVMNIRLPHSLFAAGLLLGVGALSAAELPQWKPLFNGRDLTGWVNVNTAPDTWTVRDGLLVCSGHPIGVMRSEKQYENFILHIEWRHMEPGGNSGVFVWSEGSVPKGRRLPKGMEVQMLELDWVKLHPLKNGFPPPIAYVHGELFGAGGLKATPDHPRGSRSKSIENRCLPRGQWNVYDVVCVDGTVKLAVNGKFVNSIRDSSVRKGYLCLESEGAEIHFRNIQILELPPGVTTPDQVAPVVGGPAPEPAPGAQAGPPWLDGVRRVLILGDSITYSGQYAADLEAWVRLRWPRREIEFLNLGLPSETVSGLSEPGHAGGKFPRPDLHERLGRTLPRIQPDLVLAAYGMNDGIYYPLSEARFRAYREGIAWLAREVADAGARLVLVTPTVFDPVPIRDRTLPAGLEEYRRPYVDYDDVLTRYAAWLCEQRARGWTVVDVHTPMRRYLEARRRTDPAFSLTRDGVHINDLGHWLVAREIINQLSGSEVAKWPTLDAMLRALGGGEGPAIYQLIRERQRLMCDAWLTAIGHERPGMTRGLLLEQAQARADALDAKLRALLRKLRN